MMVGNILPIVLLYLVLGVMVSMVWAGVYGRDEPFGAWTAPITILFPLVLLVAVIKALFWLLKNSFHKSGLVMLFVAMKHGEDGLDQYEERLRHSSK